MSSHGLRGLPHCSLPQRRRNWTRKVYEATGMTYTTITQARKVWRQLEKPRGGPMQRPKAAP